MPVLEEVRSGGQGHQGRHRLHGVGLDRLPRRRRLQLRDDPRRRRPVAAHPGEPRRDGRRLRPLRGVGEAPARRRRLRPDLRLRQVVAGPDPRGAVAASSTRTTSPRCGPTRSAWPPCRPGSASRRAPSPRSRWPRSPAAAAATPSTTPTPSCKWDRIGRGAPRRGADRRPAAAERLPADHRRRRRRDHRRRRLRPGALRAAGVDPRHRPPHRPDGARPARPGRVAVGEAGGREGRRRRRWLRHRRAPRPVHATRS